MNGRTNKAFHLTACSHSLARPQVNAGVGLRKLHREVMKPLRDTPGHGLMGKTLSLVVILALGILSVPATGAPQPGKVYKIGVLHPGSGSEERLAALREAGYIEGRNLVIEPRYAQGREERLPALARELIALKPT